MTVVDPSIVICVPERILLQVGQASRDSLSLSVSFLCPIAAVILSFLDGIACVHNSDSLLFGHANTSICNFIVYNYY